MVLPYTTPPCWMSGLTANVPEGVHPHPVHSGAWSAGRLTLLRLEGILLPPHQHNTTEWHYILTSEDLSHQLQVGLLVEVGVKREGMEGGGFQSGFDVDHAFAR